MQCISFHLIECICFPSESLPLILAGEKVVDSFHTGNRPISLSHLSFPVLNTRLRSITVAAFCATQLLAISRCYPRREYLMASGTFARIPLVQLWEVRYSLFVLLSSCEAVLRCSAGMRMRRR